MRKSNITIYDLDMKKVAMLENANRIGYETPMNTVWTASFELPLDDPKNEYCRPFYYVELFDGRERLELFRILPQTAKRSEQTQYVQYTCEHVLATLLDDVLFQHHTIGNLGIYTADVLEYILNRQTTKRWQLGTVEFNRQFEYNWENAGLLAALFSVPKPFADEYQWTFDTTTYPWTLNLVKPSDQVQAYIRYGKNMRGITKSEDPTNLINRVYALGYGEGVNQLNFADINDGKPYVEDAESISKYGLKATVWADRRFTSAETLLGRALTILDESKNPRMTYTVQAEELYALTRDPADKFKSGTLVRVQDPDIGDVTLRVVNVKKRNVRGAPGNVTLEIANRPKDMSGTVADLQNRMKIEEVYAQGATNIVSHDFADNCDPDHPAVLRLWIPDEAVKINKVLLTYEVDNFRGYSRGAASGGGASVTSASGGGTTVSSASGGGTSTSSGPSSISTTASGGGSTISFFEKGMINFGRILPSDKNFMRGTGNHDHQGQVPSDGYHVHDLYDFSLFLPDHVHDMPHTHSIVIMPHQHSVTVQPHQHTVTIDPHTHEQVYGIFRGPKPSSIEVEVDGTQIPGLGLSGSNVELSEYLSVDDSGKIARGRFHEIKITPNDLGRITATVTIQLFVQSRGGGDF